MRSARLQDRVRNHGPTLGVLMIAVMAVLASCGRSPASSGTQPTASPISESPAAGSIWLAGLEVAPAPDGLDAATAALAGPLGDALVVAPVACYAGLPPAAGDGYLLGVVADSKEGAEAIAAKAEVPVLFVVATTTACAD